MIHTHPTISKWISGLDTRSLRAVQVIAQAQIGARQRIEAQLSRLTADYDHIGTFWVSTVNGLKYAEKAGYLVLDTAGRIAVIQQTRMESGGMIYQLMPKEEREYTVDYDHPLAVYRLHDPERLLRDQLQRQIGHAFRRNIKLQAKGDHRYSFRLLIPETAERYFTRMNVLRYLQKHVKGVSAVEQVIMTGQGSQTLVEVRLCLPLS
jgi:hypothetical protein